MDKNKLNPDRFTIKFNETVFRDIDEFIIDMKNIFTYLIEIYYAYKNNSKNILDKKEIEKAAASMLEQIKKLQQNLQDKLTYITDNTKIDESLLAGKRGKLAQFKSLNQFTDLSVNTEEHINKLKDFFYNRILEGKVAVTKKIIFRKTDN